MRFSPAEFPLPVKGLLQVELETTEHPPISVDASVAASVGTPKSPKGRGSAREPALPASAMPASRDPLA